MASSKKRQSSDLHEHVSKRLQMFSLAQQHVAVALSGGLDSIVLLHLMARAQASCGFNLSAVHINHQLSPNASQWTGFCASVCSKSTIPFQMASVNVVQGPGISLEAAARDARYQALSALGLDCVALGHHLDDQVETFLLQLLRGSGAKGLAAMPFYKSDVGGTLSYIRPLLDVPRSEILHYAVEHKLTWIEDESNANPDFNRNYLRHEIFPHLEKRFPGYRKTIYRSTQNLAESARLIREIEGIDLASALIGECLNLGYLLALTPERAKNLLLAFLQARNVPTPTSARLQQLIQQIKARPDASISLKMGGCVICRYQDRLYVESPSADNPLNCDWQGEPELRIEAIKRTLVFENTLGLGASLQKLKKNPVRIRWREGGEKFRPNCHRPRRTLKNLLQEARIPPWERLSTPLIFSGNDLAAVVGIGIDCLFKAEPDEPGLLVRWKV